MTDRLPPIEWVDGYPTEASLEALARVGCLRLEAARYLRQELARCARNCGASYEEEPSPNDDPATWFGRKGLRLSFSTGGWSGAADLIAVLLDKFWIRHFQTEWRRGGHYVFEVPVDDASAT